MLRTSAFLVALLAVTAAAQPKKDNKKPVASYKDGRLTFNGKTLPKLPCDAKELQKVFGKPSREMSELITPLYLYDDLGLEIGVQEGKATYVQIILARAVDTFVNKAYAGTVSIDGVAFAANSDIAVIGKKVPKLKQDKLSPYVWQTEDRTIGVIGKPRGPGLVKITFGSHPDEKK